MAGCPENQNTDIMSVVHARIFEPEITGLLASDNRHYLERVMRLSKGDPFTLTNGNGREASAVLTGDGKYEIESWRKPLREPPVKITLCASLIKGDRFENLIEKGVELGATKIIPLLSERCIVKAPSSDKLARWRKIALTAMLQCGGCMLPLVTEPVVTMKMPPLNETETGILLHEAYLYGSAAKRKFADSLSEIRVATGPEGGFSRSEVEFLISSGWIPKWLGPRLFRADTASLAAIAAILLGRTMSETD